MMTLHPIASTIRASAPAQSALASSEATLRQTLRELDPGGQAEHLASQLESNFFGMVLRAMRDTVPEAGLLGGAGEARLYRGLLDEEYSRVAADRWRTDFHDALVRQILNPSGAASAPKRDATPTQPLQRKEAHPSER
jgi:Rod binding domain-containing protein